jgi:hypothetical protein
MRQIILPALFQLGHNLAFEGLVQGRIVRRTE